MLPGRSPSLDVPNRSVTPADVTGAQYGTHRLYTGLYTGRYTYRIVQGGHIYQGVHTPGMVGWHIPPYIPPS